MNDQETITATTTTTTAARGKNLKRNIVMAAVLLFVCAAVYLNWSYNSKTGTADPAMVAAEEAADESVSPYFSTARLTRQQSRDEALSLLETAAASESASQETIDSAMASIATMATWSMQEAQIENLLLAKDFTDCVVYISAEGVTVAVPAPAEGLSEAAVARITDVITGETDFEASQLKLIEIKDQ